MLSHDFLKQTGLFKELTDEELLEIILIGHVKTFKAGSVIFEEGAPGDCLFLIISGSVRISKIQAGTEEALAVLETRSFFGEMTLFDRVPARRMRLPMTMPSFLSLPEKTWSACFRITKRSPTSSSGLFAGRWQSVCAPPTKSSKFSCRWQIAASR